MHWEKKVVRASWLLPLLGFLSACGDGEEACASDCPATGRAVSDGDLRLRLERENSSVAFKDGSRVVDGAITRGELVIRPQRAECIATPASPCSATIRQLSVTITNLTVDGLTFKDPTLSIETPLKVVDTGSGFVIEEGTPVHNCVRLRGAQQHAVHNPATAANLFFDDTWSPGGWARLTAWWPLALALPDDECQAKTLELAMGASFARE